VLNIGSFSANLLLAFGQIEPAKALLCVPCSSELHFRPGNFDGFLLVLPLEQPDFSRKVVKISSHGTGVFRANLGAFNPHANWLGGVQMAKIMARIGVRMVRDKRRRR